MTELHEFALRGIAWFGLIIGVGLLAATIFVCSIGYEVRDHDED